MTPVSHIFGTAIAATATARGDTLISPDADFDPLKDKTKLLKP